jgi:hypothetical protein
MSTPQQQQFRLEGTTVLTVLLKEGGDTFNGWVVKLDSPLEGSDHILIIDVKGLKDVPHHWQVVFLDGNQVSYLQQRNAGDTDEWSPFTVKFLTAYGTP